VTTSYEAYIRPADLPAVTPLAAVGTPDEQFFIRTHQAFEIWFAHILAELEFARAELARVPVPEQNLPLITHHVRRASGIFELLQAHLPLLETLLTTDFFDFRGELFGAGGKESYRFREIEWLMGFRDPGLLDYLKTGKSAFASERDALRRYQELEAKRIAGSNPRSHASLDALRARQADLAQNNSLRHHLLQWLRRTPYPDPDGSGPADSRHVARFAARFAQHFEMAYRNDLKALAGAGAFSPAEGEPLLTSARARLRWFLAEPERCATLFILQFAQQPRLAAAAELLEAMLELDETFLNWRDRHMEMVARVIGGGRISTMGAADSGLGYLRETTATRAFPELWDARSFLLGHAEAQGVYSGEPGAWGHWRDFRLAFEVR
jgi:tryptophan 2,3-dioxygenase